MNSNASCGLYPFPKKNKRSLKVLMSLIGVSVSVSCMCRGQVVEG